MFNSLWPHRLPCFPESSTSGFPVLHHLPEFAQTHVHWVSDAIQPFHLLSSRFSSCPQSFPASESCPVSLLLAPGGQSIGASALASVLPVKIQGWFLFVCICLLYVLHVSEIMQYLSVFVCLISLFIISFRFTHVITCGRISFFLMLTNILLYVYTTLSFSVYPWMDIKFVSIAWLSWIMLQWTWECIRDPYSALR